MTGFPGQLTRQPRNCVRSCYVVALASSVGVRDLAAHRSAERRRRRRVVVGFKAIELGYSDAAALDSSQTSAESRLDRGQIARVMLKNSTPIRSVLGPAGLPAPTPTAHAEPTGLDRLTPTPATPAHMAGGIIPTGRRQRRLDSASLEAQSARFMRQYAQISAFRPPSEGGKRAGGAAKGRVTPVILGHLRSLTVTRKPPLSWSHSL